MPALPNPFHRPRLPRPARAGLTLVAAGALLAAAPLSASAHVRVAADHPVTGSFTSLTFRVPNEEPTADTVKVSVELPTDRPFLEVSTKPVTGWTVVATEATLPKPVEFEGTTVTKAIRTVTWTAAERGAAIKPDQYQEFSLSVGPLPDPGPILLPATQTYSDGKVVRWNEPTPASGEEPENPAPVVDVVAAATGPATTTASAAPAASTAPNASTPPAATTASADSTARGLGAAALAVALAGVVVAAVGLRRRRTAV